VASSATVRRKLSALSSLFDYLCEKNAVTHNPVKGVKRPNEGSYEGKTPALSDAQARNLLAAPDVETLKGKRDKAMLAVLLFHAMRREEVAKLNVKDVQMRQGVLHFKVKGKRDKIRYIPVNPEALRLMDDYLESAGHSLDKNGPLFRPLKNNTTGTLKKHLHSDSLYQIVVAYAEAVGLKKYVEGRWVHLARATAITNALEHGADIAKVQEWAGHANIATTRLYDRRKTKPEDSPTFRVRY
jgi:integrase/recombinase XerD